MNSRQFKIGVNSSSVSSLVAPPAPPLMDGATKRQLTTPRSRSSRRPLILKEAPRGSTISPFGSYEIAAFCARSCVMRVQRGVKRHKDDEWHAGSPPTLGGTLGSSSAKASRASSRIGDRGAESQRRSRHHHSCQPVLVFALLLHWFGRLYPAVCAPLPSIPGEMATLLPPITT